MDVISKRQALTIAMIDSRLYEKNLRVHIGYTDDQKIIVKLLNVDDKSICIYIIRASDGLILKKGKIISTID